MEISLSVSVGSQLHEILPSENFIRYLVNNQTCSYGYRVWVVYQQLWGSFGAAHYVPSLQVCSEEKLCQDLLHLMVGLPSLNFPWHQVGLMFFAFFSVCCLCK